MQELVGSTPTANLLGGLGLDQWFARTDSSGARSFLTDALGSTLALADASGTMQTQYAYEPYGKATQSGAASSNAFQCTGRENDGTGLAYYRVRYYAPGKGRFIAEDPLGLSDVDFDGGASTITTTDRNGNVLRTFPVANNTTSTSNGPWPNGTYPYSHYQPHPESGATGPYGSNGNFVFDVPGRSGMGIHSGRRDPQSKTLGCIRTTDEATDFLRTLHGTDPLQTITVR